MKRNSGSPAKSTTTIRSRLTGVVVVPSVILLVMWAVFSSYTVFDGIYLKAVTSGVKDASIPAVDTFAALQRERQLTMTALSTANPDTLALKTQQQTTDKVVGELRLALDGLSANAPAEVNARVQALNQALAPLPQRRAQVESGRANRDEIYTYYNTVLDAGTALFDTQARIVPDSVVVQAGLTATDIFRAADRMSRASSLGAAALAAGSFTADQHVEFANLVGSYRATAASASAVGTDEVKAHYQRLTSAESWLRLTAAENALIGAAPRLTDTGNRRAEPLAMPVNPGEWEAVTQSASEELIKLAIEQATGGVELGLQRADDKFFEVIIGSLIALLAVVTGIVLAVRISRRLVNKALVTRLDQLKSDSLQLAHEKLPSIVDRLRQGDRVDVGAEVPPLDYGTDEIGQVADAFNAAQYTAIAAAVKESQAREGVNRVFLGIAHRHQGLVHRQLKILDKMEREEENPEHLDSLFQLDHLATRARRNAENLIILAGEQPGRQWRKPVRLLDILRAAVAETEQYVRVRVRQVPDVALNGVAVADTIHLVAELVDNAASFSPPRSQVEVYTSQVSGGVVVEIEDHGLGMTAEDREQHNQMLAHPPEFDAMALRGESRLGLFVVARLAARRAIRVELRESPYGGTVALVFIPADIVAETPDFVPESDAPSPRPRKALDRAATGAVVDSDTVVELVEPRGGIDKFWSDAVGDDPARAGAEAAHADLWPLTDEEAPDHHPGAGAGNGVGDSHTDNGHRDGARAADGAPAVRGERPTLPRRQRQQNLAPQLRDEPLLPDWESEPDPPEQGEQTAARVRDTMAAFQRGTKQARRTDGAQQ
ncbi:nitrate- and nitrite sensing domain-containing protein [Actinokineospora globicatena]|uniref:nitrate- and nitrite sensing domain-containing protein n=1 Tax=Actinokineospora globicatena TaxID=103729 RepID=UPI0020A603E6|nr:nitrate- and nitrite sensing domain-containing protein [Actinokineospora globicatena]MCP2306843.1 Signal transduction histidine kinase [Actinokineospora globicatena]GLW82284.1 histidine kinase [Actinokineospora globicatena]GLW89123.1 histidine kinase [Actinokineospora globicatena]